MNVDEIIIKNKLLEEELQKIKDELIQTKQHLNIYTMKNKKYYENNKEEHKQRVKEYKEKLIILLIYQVKKRRNMHDEHT